MHHDHGKTMAEELAACRARGRSGCDHADRKPVLTRAPGHSRGTSRPGCVAKITGLKNPAITGPARVFDSEPRHGRHHGAKITGDVLVIRYEG
jgi:dihydroxy-acid dehydratase